MNIPTEALLNAYGRFLDRGSIAYNRLYLREPELKETWVDYKTIYKVRTGKLQNVENGVLVKHLAKNEHVGTNSVEWCEVDSKPAADEVVSRYWFAAKYGCAMVMDVFSKNDHGRGIKLWPSDIFFQCWLDAAARANKCPSTLRIVAIDTILNEETKAAIWWAQKTSNCSADRLSKDDDVFPLPDRGYRVYTNIDAGFYAILGSPLGSIIGRCLEERFHILRLIIEKIVVLGLPDDAELEDFEQSRKLYFVLRNHF